MFYYNIKIKTNNGEYCLESTDKDITQREMDIYFAAFYNASEEFKSKIKKIERINTIQKTNYEYEAKKLTTEKITEQLNETTTKEEVKEEIKKTPTQKTNDEFIQLVNPAFNNNLNQGYKVSDITQNVAFTKPEGIKVEKETIFKPVAKEELVFNNIKPIEEAEENKEQISLEDFNGLKTEELKSNNEIKIIDNKNLKINNISENQTTHTANETKYVEPIQLVEDSEDINTQEIDNVIQIEDTVGIIKDIQDDKPRVDETVLSKTPVIKEDLPEIISIKEQQEEIMPQVAIENTISSKENKENTGSSEDFQIIGLEPSNRELREERLKEEKQNNLNKTIEMVQNAINDVDISSDATFNIDIPDTYSKRLTQQEIDEAIDKEFDEDFDEEDKNFESDLKENNQQIQKPMQNIEQNSLQFEDKIQNTSTEPEISSIFSDESPFENPPESQNIIAAKEYPETKQALNLDFKTFLSNYNSNGIIDEFLICAYYIKHISGQHSFNMKYINSKLFQATGNIADSSVIEGLINGQFIKVIDIEGVKKYTISSIGEEYFMNHYQR